MGTIAKKHQDKLDEIKENVQDSYNYFLENYATFNNYKKFVFLSTLDQRSLDNLSLTKKPPIEVNSGEAYLSRLRGEFSKQMPAIKISTASSMDMQDLFLDQQMVDFLEGHMRYFMNSQAQHVNTKYDIYSDLVGGGFCVCKVFTEYDNDRSFLQSIKFKKVDDPLMCGFDPDAKLPDKSDGKYCYELIPLTKEEFKKQFPHIDVKQLSFNSPFAGVRWSFSTSNNRKKLILCQYYEKQIKTKKLILLSNRVIIYYDEYDAYLENYNKDYPMMQTPQIIKDRKVDVNEIHLYRFIEDQVIEHVTTDYPDFPLIFFDGNSVEVRGSIHSSVDNNNLASGEIKQYTRPYLWHTKGVQQFKNFALQSLANEFENMTQNKWMAPLEGIIPEYKEAYINPQIPTTMIYRQFMESDPDKIVNPPSAVPRQPIPPELANAILLSDKMMQTMLGSYDAELGINKRDLSGVAIANGAMQSNASANPYNVSFMNGLTSAANLILKLIPKYYTTPRTMPIVNKEGKNDFIKINQNGKTFRYPDNALQVEVKAGANLSIQKDRQLKVIMELMKMLPSFAQYINQSGIPIILENIEINGIDKLIAGFENWQKQEQQKQQQQQPDPNVMKQQNEQMKIQLSSKQMEQDAQIKEAEIALDQAEIENEKLRIMLDAKNKKDQNSVQVLKSQTERTGQAVELALKGADMEHRHRKDNLEAINKKSDLQNEKVDNSE